MPNKSEQPEKFYSQERKAINNSLNKIKNLIDSLKYYVAKTKSKEKSVEYIGVVTQNLEEILRYELEKNFKLINDGLEEEKKKKEKEEKEYKKAAINPNSSLAKLGQIMKLRTELKQKKAQIDEQSSAK